jgi:four helix bundle protein
MPDREADSAREKPIRQRIRAFPAGSRNAPTFGVAVPYDIQERSFLFACQVVTFCRRLQTADIVVRRLSWQLLDSGTSIGANLQEADAGQTKRDFIAKASIARKESAESWYWLRLIAFAQPGIGQQTVPLIDESNQIFKILTTIIRKAESNPDRGA